MPSDLDRTWSPPLSAPGEAYSRDQETSGALGQAQAGQEADDQVQDEEQEVGEPSGVGTGTVKGGAGQECSSLPDNKFSRTMG